MKKLSLLLILAGVTFTFNGNALENFRNEMDTSAEMFSDPILREASEAGEELPATLPEEVQTPAKQESVSEEPALLPAEHSSEADAIIQEELGNFDENEELIMPEPPVLEDENMTIEMEK